MVEDESDVGTLLDEFDDGWQLFSTNTHIE